MLKPQSAVSTVQKTRLTDREKSAPKQYPATASSMLTTSTLGMNISASLPAVVVLPAPWRPTSMITVMPVDERVILLWVPPKSSVSSSRTILMTVWSGFRLPKTSSPMAFSRTWAMKSLATLKLTSASRRALLTSRRAPSISLSESLPFPRRSLNADCSLSPKLSNGIRSPQSHKQSISTRALV